MFGMRWLVPLRRYRVTHRDVLRDVTEATSCSVVVRGNYYKPGSQIAEGDRKLYLYIEVCLQWLSLRSFMTIQSFNRIGMECPLSRTNCMIMSLNMECAGPKHGGSAEGQAHGEAYHRGGDREGTEKGGQDIRHLSQGLASAAHICVQCSYGITHLLGGMVARKPICVLEQPLIRSGSCLAGLKTLDDLRVSPLELSWQPVAELHWPHCSTPPQWVEEWVRHGLKGCAGELGGQCIAPVRRQPGRAMAGRFLSRATPRTADLPDTLLTGSYRRKQLRRSIASWGTVLGKTRDQGWALIWGNLNSV